jgi:sugar fermentation stimulation protein A
VGTAGLAEYATYCRGGGRGPVKRLQSKWLVGRPIGRFVVEMGLMENEVDLASAACAVPFSTLVPAAFVRRDNRFRVQVETEWGLAAAHLPNSGRLEELLMPGAPVWLTPAGPAARARRRTGYDLTLVEYSGRLVSVDARLPTELVAIALERDCAPGLPRYPVVKREVALGKSRIDFWLGGSPTEAPCWLEAKSVTLVIDGAAQFPDAPTARGRRHLSELVTAVQKGEKAMVVFVIQRDDACCFSPHDSADPAFGDALRQAAFAGVEIVALGCRLTVEAIQLCDSLPVVM